MFTQQTDVSAMVRFLGQRLPDSKKLWVALTQIYGVGYTRAKSLCFAIGATPNTNAGDLRPYHIGQLYAAAEARYMLGNDLRAANTENIRRLIRIKCYRGTRHLQRLPVRGQRTHSNHRTQKKRFPPST